MIRNQKGVTLIELLAVLSIAAICFALIFGIWLSGIKSSERTVAQNELQADAHLVQSRLTTAFYNKNDKPFTIVLNNDQVGLKYDGEDQAEIISDSSLIYSGHSSETHVDKNTHKLELNFNITPKDASDNSDLEFSLKTTLNYPWEEGVESE